MLFKASRGEASVEFFMKTMVLIIKYDYDLLRNHYFIADGGEQFEG